jgi:peptide/nickel transport system permease protein
MKVGRGRRILLGAAALVVALVVFAALFGPWLTPEQKPSTLSDSLARPGWKHLLGADQQGRDVLVRIVLGARVAMLAATEATLLAVAIGIPLGLLIGFRGGRVDLVTMRVIDGISAIPGVVLAIALIATLGTGLSRSMLAVGLVFSMVMARIARGQVLAERERQYVDGARVAGVRQRGLLFGHVLPNVAPALIVQATVVFSAAITIEAGLSFIGLGVQPPTASWGIMLADAQDMNALRPFLSVPPGAAILLTVLSINVLGDFVQGLVVGNQRSGDGTVLDPARVRRADKAASVPERASRPGVARSGVALDVDRLDISYRGSDGSMVMAVSAATLHVRRGEVLAVVGESGCGKSSLGLGIAGLLAPPAVLSAHSVRLEADDAVFELTDEDPRHTAWRRHVAIIFQEPAASLNPVHTVGRHLMRALQQSGVAKAACEPRAIQLLEQVRIQEPAETMRRYPHQLSGGMAQRVMIALALAQDPAVLVADEPTTALDVTVQAEILGLLRQLCKELHLSILLITHDLGVVAELADRVAVMYAGQIIEVGTVVEVIAEPRHPYTAALAAAVPRNEKGAGIPEPLEGTVPEPGHWPTGCRFAERCADAVDRCREAPVALEDVTGRQVACLRADELQLIGVPPRRA